MNLRPTFATKIAAGSLALASLGIGGLALAPAAGAATPATTTRAPKDEACQRAHDAWQRIVAANDRAVAAYHELRVKQQDLIANGHEVAAHRLDARLDRARRAHERAVARTLVIAERVQGFCTEQPPTLTPVE